ncbi:Chloride channel protein [Wickerhamomyces ciferrii]|uniref:Chloride channel protein n=1 Tax=Wickerhamomyces ciferrii (strain ATCC 14091 / BCRC 22168 / CBS 111 / JCM 3599 / NBRC 0793 / NRRL Y-1031 F-60-10) TaxID=1206466 RepID=K0KTL7_WICCF|nr:Chloride channel protein [Wickerhamomyces ciferrii]CCH44724.1 Chloride channel protein [Wickerhamomyces ciferrii]
MSTWDLNPDRWDGIPIIEFQEETAFTTNTSPIRQKHYKDLSSIDWPHEYSRERQSKKQNDIQLESSHSKWHAFIRNSSKWIVLIGTGVLIGILTASLDYLYKWLTDLKGGVCKQGVYMTYSNCCKGINEGDVCENWLQWDQVIHINKNAAGSFIYKYFLYLITSLILAVSTAFIVKDTAFIKTSGISEAKTIISGLVIKDYLTLKTMLVKFIGLTLIVSSGMWAGKEGPLVHVSCCCADFIIKRLPSLNNNEAIRRELLLAATAAGISVAFNAPIGGVLFTLEQVTSYFNASDKMWSSFVCCMAGVVVLNSFKENTDVLVTMENQWLSIEMLGFILLGILGGVYGAVFNRLNMWFAQLRERLVKTQGEHFQVLEIIGLSIVTSVITYPLIFPRLPLTTLITRLYKDCAAEESNIIGGLCDDSKFQGSSLLFLTGIVAVLLTSYTFGTSVPAGVLMPSLTIGAIVGRLLGIVFESLQNSNGTLSRLCEENSTLCISPGAYAVVGSAAFLTGVTKMTVWVVVTVFELTGALTYVLPIMITVLVARWTSDKFDEKGCYDLWIQFFGYPYLNEILKPLPLIKSEVFMTPMEKMNVLYVEDRTTVEDLKYLVERDFQGIPVLFKRDDPKLLGWISLSDLKYELDKNYNLSNSTNVTLVENESQELGPGLSFPEYNLIEKNYVNLSPNLPLPTLVEYFFKLKPRFVLFSSGGNFKGTITLKDISRIVELSTNELLKISEQLTGHDDVEDLEDEVDSNEVLFRNEMTNNA